MKTIKLIFTVNVLLIGLGLLILQGCAPVFSELQSARTVGDNRVEFTPSISTVDYTEDGEREGLQNHIGLQAAYGITDKIDIRARYERIWIKEEGIDEGVSVFGIGPKFSLLENKIALYIPIGRAFGDETEETWQIHPTLLLTYPAVEDKLDITLSPKYLITLCEGCEDLIAVNLGLSFGNDLKQWSIRPEYGILFNPGESGYFGQFSIGYSTTFGGNK
jgi:hypothetical protein